MTGLVFREYYARIFAARNEACRVDIQLSAVDDHVAEERTVVLENGSEVARVRLSIENDAPAVNPHISFVEGWCGETLVIFLMYGRHLPLVASIEDWDGFVANLDARS